jgi:hypothetical protein
MSFLAIGQKRFAQASFAGGDAPTVHLSLSRIRSTLTLGPIVTRAPGQIDGPCNEGLMTVL